LAGSQKPRFLPFTLPFAAAGGGSMKSPEQAAHAVATSTRPGDPDRFFPGHTPRSTDSVHTRHRPHVLSSCTARRRRSRNWCRRHYCRSIARTMDGRSQQSWETQRERRRARKMRATNHKPSVSFESPWFVSLTQRRWNCLVPVKTTLRSPGSLMPARARPAVSSSSKTSRRTGMRSRRSSLLPRAATLLG
jgi:hypothetical protein